MDRPPSVDALARRLATEIDLPHPLLVDAARGAIAAGDVDSAPMRARELARTLSTRVVNATGVVLHTNLGRAPVAMNIPDRPNTVEFDLATGRRGSRHRGAALLISRLIGAESALVVNNNAAAVLLVVAALGGGRSVAVSRGESVEIGGSFRVPEVMEQGGARLVDVGTTNRTRLEDYRRVVERAGSDIAMTLKVHPSNYRVEGFVEAVSVSELASLEVPCVADLGSGLLDAACWWLSSGPPAWLNGEPAARQTLEAGAALVTFSTDKLLGGPQGGIIAGRADLVAACARHPLARALRPGGHILSALETTLLAYLRRDAQTTIPFWRLISTPVEELERRAHHLAAMTHRGDPVATTAVPGAGSAPGVAVESYGLALDGDVTAALRDHDPPVIARVRDDVTILDLRSVEPDDDVHIAEAVRGLR